MIGRVRREALESGIWVLKQARDQGDADVVALAFKRLQALLPPANA